MLEAATLQEDLHRADIEPSGVEVNGSLAAVHPSDPLLAARVRTEIPQLEKVQHGLAHRVALVPWLAQEPVGAELLRELTRSRIDGVRKAGPSAWWSA